MLSRVRMSKSTDWPLEFCVANGEVKRGPKFHGTEQQLIKYLQALNNVGANGVWDVDREQLPDFKLGA